MVIPQLSKLMLGVRFSLPANVLALRSLSVAVWIIFGELKISIIWLT